VLFILQKTVKSIQRHLHEFLDELAGGGIFEPVTASAWTHARAKLKHTAFIELNAQTVLPWIYKSPSTLVASTAAHALVRFKEQAEMIIPALEKAAKRKDNAGGPAKWALKQLESQAASNRGVPK